MKGKYTFNRLLHNNKLMIAFSVVAAIAIWASVIFGASVPDTGAVNVNVSMDMSNSWPGSTGLVNFSDSTIQVQVEVSGGRAVVKSLLESDINVTPDFNTVLGAGEAEVFLKCSKSSTSNKDFDIVGSPNPESVKIFCDYAQTKSVPISADISGISAKDTVNTYIGTPIISDLNSSEVKVYGPQSVVSKIETVVAKVDKAESISEAQSYSATLVAYDNNGNSVDLKYCRVEDLDTSKLAVIVPVYSTKTINLTMDSFDVKNAPAVYKNNPSFFSINPNSIQLSGPPDQLSSYVKNLGKIGVIDFSHINAVGSSVKIPLNIPQGIREKNGIADVTVGLAMQNFTSVTMNVPLSGSNTQFQNTAGRTATVQQTIGVTIVGPVDSIAKVKETDVSAVVDLANDGSQGTREVNAAIQINGFTDVWAYYGNSGNGYPVSVSVQ